MQHAHTIYEPLSVIDPPRTLFFLIHARVIAKRECERRGLAGGGENMNIQGMSLRLRSYVTGTQQVCMVHPLNRL